MRMVSHHRAILAVPCGPIIKPAGFVLDLVGARTRIEYFEGLPAQGASPFEQAEVMPAPPEIGEAYFEWIDTLESVLEARGQYVVCELGAGWGRWCVRAVCALRQLNPMPFKCIAAEAEPQHFRWMVQHFADNAIDPADHDLRWAAVAPTAGAVPFAIGDPSRWYGQAIVEHAPPPLGMRERRRLAVRGLLGRPPRYGADRDVVWVPAVTLWDLLTDESRVDLLDVDVQGAEQRILESAASLLDDRVRRIHIGTHSNDIEEGLRRLFRSMGWQPQVDYSCHSNVDTPYGTVSFVDGVQSWVNPRLAYDRPTREPVQDPESVASRLDVDTVDTAADLRSTIDRLRARNADLKIETAELREKLRARDNWIKELKTAVKASKR
jgi:FkbM family methyltransferase